jgi:hypothetical protein
MVQTAHLLQRLEQEVQAMGTLKEIIQKENKSLAGQSGVLIFVPHFPLLSTIVPFSIHFTI